MNTEDILRDMVLKKLKDAGWISGASVISQDGSQKRVSYRLDWTDRGWDMRRLFDSMFSELGYRTGYRVGELDQLHNFCIIHPGEKQDETRQSNPRQ